MLGKMNNLSKKTKFQFALNLMISTGMLLVVVAVPVGIALGFQSYFELHLEMRHSIMFGAVLTISMIVLGFIFYWSGMRILRRHNTTSATAKNN